MASTEPKPPAAPATPPPPQPDSPPKPKARPSRANETNLSLAELVARLPADASDRLGGALESAVAQVRSQRTIRVAGQEGQAVSRYATALHSFVTQLEHELSQIVDP